MLAPMALALQHVTAANVLTHSPPYPACAAQQHLLTTVTSAHLDQQGERSTLHNLPLVVVVLERKCSQGTCCCALHLEIPTVEQPDQRCNAPISAHLQEVQANMQAPSSALCWEGFACSLAGTPVACCTMRHQQVRQKCIIRRSTDGQLHNQHSQACKRHDAAKGALNLHCILTMFLISMFSCARLVIASAARRATPPLPLRAGAHSPVLDVARTGGLLMLCAASNFTRPAQKQQRSMPQLNRMAS